MIEIKNLTVKLAGNTILENISFRILPNRLLIILGESGAGKTVLIKTLIGLNQDYSGQILYDNIPIEKYLKKNDGIKTAMVFQNSALMDFMDVFENIALPLREHTKLSRVEIEKKVESILEKLNIPDLKDKMPNNLSGGMQKRVAIARAVIANPKYIFYDEPTTGLDPINATEVLNLIKETQKNISSIIVTHDKRIISKLDADIIMLKDKKIIFDGNYDNLFKANNEFIIEYLRQMNNER